MSDYRCSLCGGEFSDDDFCKGCGIGGPRAYQRVMSDPTWRPEGPLHLLERADSKSSLCGLTPCPFPLSLADLGDLPDDSDTAFLDSKRVQLLDPATCPDCVAAYYEHPNART